MKVIAAVLCLAAAANAAAVLPLETSVVKSDRVGDNFSYSIHQNQGYAVGDIGTIYPYEVKGDKIKQVIPASAYVSPVEYKHVVPLSPVEVKDTEYKNVYPVTPIELKSSVVPASTYVSTQPIKNIELKSYVQPTYVATPVKSVDFNSYVQPAVVTSPFKSVNYIQPSSVSPVITYSHDAAVPITYGSNVYSYGANVYPYGANIYPYGAYSYPIIKPEKVY